MSDDLILPPEARLDPRRGLLWMTAMAVIA